MAKKTTLSTQHAKFINEDISKWNFIIFLTLAFMLIVAVVTALRTTGGGTTDIRTRAASCPAGVTTCDKGKAVCFTGTDGCQRCVCSKK